MTEEKLLNIIIVNHNNWRYLAGCLASIFQNTISKTEYEIIVVDNASTDISLKLLEYLHEQGEPVKIIKNTENLNYVLGNNIGLKNTNSKYILFLNNDTILDKNCLKEMLNVFTLEPKAGMVGAIQYSPSGTLACPPLGKFNRNPEDWSSVGFDPCDNPEKLPKPFVEVDNTNTACAMISKEVLNKIGYMDEEFCPCMYEAEDYIMRIKVAGFKILVCTTAKLVHYVAATTNITQDTQRYYTYVVLPKNRKVFIKKWGKYFEEEKKCQKY
jgi:GT2 family glycosyltransferase